MASKNAISMHALSLAASEAAASTSPPSLSSWQPLSLDDCDSLSLSRITSSFSAPITEEHAFAVVYECVRTLSSLTKESSAKLAVVNSTQDILIHRDGRVHETTYRLEATSPTSELQLQKKTNSPRQICDMHWIGRGKRSACLLLCANTSELGNSNHPHLSIVARLHASPSLAT